jgi:hypothetical protein
MRARTGLLAIAFVVTLLLVFSAPPEARGSVSIAITWDRLLRQSTASVVVTPIEARSVWEGGRIYTYTRVHVDRSVAGELAEGGETWVRTMGGVVEKIGQIVEGEAVLEPGRPSLLFLHAALAGAVEVTGRGQGQFPVVTETSGTRLRVVRNNAVGALLAPHVSVSSNATRLAADVLHGRFVDDVAGEIAADWGRTHARP